MDMIQVITTTDTLESAEQIIEILLERRLAACIQVAGPVHSHYIWQGKRERTREYLLLIKSRGDLYEEVENNIREIHHYDVPEIISIPITHGSQGYLSWLDSYLGPTSTAKG